MPSAVARLWITSRMSARSKLSTIASSSPSGRSDSGAGSRVSGRGRVLRPCGWSREHGGDAHDRQHPLPLHCILLLVTEGQRAGRRRRANSISCALSARARDEPQPTARPPAAPRRARTGGRSEPAHLAEPHISVRQPPADLLSAPGKEPSRGFSALVTAGHSAIPARIGPRPPSAHSGRTGWWTAARLACWMGGS